MTHTPKVSIILTSYNHAKYLRESIESALSQTFTDFELIIWDDASSDNSWEIICSYTDPRIRPFRETTNDVIRNVRKAILEEARGEYIAIHHSDDAWEPEKLEKQVAFLGGHPEIGAVFTWAHIIDEDGNPLQDENHFYAKIFEQPNRTRHEWLNYFFYHGNALCHPSVLIRKQCYNDVGLYRYGLAQSPDLDMWVRLCLKDEIYILPEKLVRFRVRAGEANTSGNRPEVYVRGQFEYLQVLYNYVVVRASDEFQKIFPESVRYFQDDECDIDFALAMTAISAPYHFSRLFGLQILFKILNTPSQAGLVQRIYSFSAREFFSLTAQHDVFSVNVYAELSRQIAERNEANNALRQENNALRQENNALRQENNALRQELEHILASPGWKFVLWLRSIKNSLGFLFRKNERHKE